MQVTRGIPKYQHPLREIAKIRKEFPNGTWVLYHSSVVSRLCELSDFSPDEDWRGADFCLLGFKKTKYFDETCMYIMALPKSGWFIDRNEKTWEGEIISPIPENVVFVIMNGAF